MILTVTRKCFRGASSRTFTTATEKLINKLPLQYLRDSIEGNYDSVTWQRNDVVYDSNNGKLKIVNENQDRYKLVSSRVDGTDHVFTWADGVSSKFSSDWIAKTYSNWKQTEIGQEPWSGWTQSFVRKSKDLTINFEDAIKDEGMARSIVSLYKYGILLVTNTPTEDKGHGIVALAAALSGAKKKEVPETSLLANYRKGGKDMVLRNGTDGPLRTLYGKVWFTSSSVQEEGISVADSSYSSEALPLHTDMTYFLSPPGLQIFTMIEPAERGGDSIYADGINAAETLRSEDPHSFHLLSTLDRKYWSIDKETGWHLEAVGPVIQVRNDAVVQIRHNDLDRLPVLPPSNKEDEDKTHERFYTDLAEAHKKWDEILSRDENRLVMNLRPGDTVIIANQRCLHGRYSFQTSAKKSRIVSGCYVSQDELSSRYRMEGLQVV